MAQFKHLYKEQSFESFISFLDQYSTNIEQECSDSCKLLKNVDEFKIVVQMRIPELRDETVISFRP